MNHYTFHFCLPECAENGALQVRINEKKYALFDHTEITRNKAALENKAISLFDERQKAALTHFAQVPCLELSDENLSRIWVTAPQAENGGQLPILYHMSLYIPAAYRAKARLKRWQEEPEKNRLGLSSLGCNPKVKWLDLKLENMQLMQDQDLVAFHRDLNFILTDLDQAVAILFHHPALASNKPYAATIAMDECILPDPEIYPEQYNKMAALAERLQEQGPNQWAPPEVSKDYKGNVMLYGFSVGKHQQGDKVEHYKLSTRTELAAASPLVGALQIASQKKSLQNQAWSMEIGAASIFQSNAQKQLAVDTAPRWVWQDLNHKHGVCCSSETIAYQGDRNVKVSFSNSKLRTVCVYAAFFDAEGKQIPLKNPTRMDRHGCKYVGFLSPLNVIMGIPIFSSKTELQLNDFPVNTTKIKFIFSSLGTGDADVDLGAEPIGIILTSVFQLGIPGLFLIAGTAITNGGFLIDLMQAGAESTLEVVLGSITPEGSYELMDLQTILTMFADSIGAVLVQKGMEMVFLKLTGYVTAEALMDSMPVIGWALRLVKIAAGAVTMVETIVHVTTNPKNFAMTLAREMDVCAAILPDPAHGTEAGEAVWPLSAQNYEAVLQYKGRTNKVIRGTIPSQGKPISLMFSNIPIGGECALFVNLYSETGWLCGKYESGTINAVPNTESGLQIKGQIKEILVPLLSDTQYLYDRTLQYSEKENYHWLRTKAATATFADLDASGYGDTLCGLYGMTLNEKKQQVGHLYAASGEGASAGIHYFAQSVTKLDLPSIKKQGTTPLAGKVHLALDRGGNGTENYLLDTDQQLRKLDLSKDDWGLGQSSSQCYGRFTLNNIDRMIYHPDGKVIAVDWGAQAMEIVELKAPMSIKQAGEGYKVGGKGSRQGLVNGPMAMDIALDGRVLLLESQNMRIQAFDSTMQPVACFVGQTLVHFTDATLRPALKQHQIPTLLWAQLMNSENYRKCSLTKNAEWITRCNAGSLTANQCKILTEKGLYFYSNMHSVSKAEWKDCWELVDFCTEERYTIRVEAERIVFYQKPKELILLVKEEPAEGAQAKKNQEQWQLVDQRNGWNFLLTAEAGKVDCYRLEEYLSYFKLRQQTKSITWLDLAVEEKGYLYVLYCYNGGKAVNDFYVDVYDPAGNWLSTTPDRTEGVHICAQHFAVDKWRTMFTQNFESMHGPAGRREPTISMWQPTTPKKDGSDM